MSSFAISNARPSFVPASSSVRTSQTPVRATAPVAELRPSKSAGTYDPMLDLDAAPVLPSSSSGAATPAELREHIAVFNDISSDGAGALMWHSLSAMANSAMIDQQLASQVKQAMQQAQTAAKKNEIRANEQRIAAERSAALVTLVGSVVGSGLSAGLGVAAGAASSNTVGGALQATAKAVGDLGQQAVKYVNKVAGPERTADEKKIEASRHELMGALASQNVESAKASYDEAREQMKLALKLLTEHCERATQISATVTRV